MDILLGNSLFEGEDGELLGDGDTDVPNLEVLGSGRSQKGSRVKNSGGYLKEHVDELERLF